MLTEQQIADLREKHGRVAHVVGEDDAWEIVIKAPTREQYAAFKSALQDDVQKPKATELLFRKLVVFPENFDALLDQYPAIPDACSDDLLSLMGGKAKKRQK